MSTMTMTSMMMPLRDVTQNRLSTANRQFSAKDNHHQLIQQQQQMPVHMSALVIPATQQQQQQQQQVRVRRNDPYNWEWRVMAPIATSPISLMPAVMVTPIVTVQPQQQQQVSHMASPMTVVGVEEPSSPTTFTATGTPVCNALVQFKCHHGEFSSDFEVRKGQYVAVQGDRGLDLGVVIRINTEENQQYVERTGPSGSVLRYATQREVDYWATDLKADEGAALEYCRQRVLKHRLQMDVRHAEYQFDKKKLTFYYEAKTRVDFVTLLKELFREFSCRIWMEKVRTHE